MSATCSRCMTSSPPRRDGDRERCVRCGHSWPASEPELRRGEPVEYQRIRQLSTWLRHVAGEPLSTDSVTHFWPTSCPTCREIHESMAPESDHQYECPNCGKAMSIGEKPHECAGRGGVKPAKRPRSTSDRCPTCGASHGAKSPWCRVHNAAWCPSMHGGGCASCEDPWHDGHDATKPQQCYGA